MVTRGDEDVELAEAGQYRTTGGAVAHKVHGVVVNDFSVGFPDLGIGLVLDVASQLVDGVGSGFRVPGLPVVEGDALAQGQPPGIGHNLLKAGESCGSGVGEFRPEEGNWLGNVMDYLIGVQSSADPGIGDRGLFVDYDYNIVPGGLCHHDIGGPRCGLHGRHRRVCRDRGSFHGFLLGAGIGHGA